MALERTPMGQSSAEPPSPNPLPLRFAGGEEQPD